MLKLNKNKLIKWQNFAYTPRYTEIIKFFMQITKLDDKHYKCKIDGNIINTCIDSRLKSQLKNISTKLNKTEMDIIKTIVFNRFQKSQNILSSTILHYNDKDILKLTNEKI